MANDDVDIDKPSVSVAYIEGVGLIRVSGNITREKYGKGSVHLIDKIEYATVAVIELESGRKPMLVTKEHFLPVQRDD
jgi:hypothetical protein